MRGDDVVVRINYSPSPPPISFHPSSVAMFKIKRCGRRRGMLQQPQYTRYHYISPPFASYPHPSPIPQCCIRYRSSEMQLQLRARATMQLNYHRPRVTGFKAPFSMPRPPKARQRWQVKNIVKRDRIHYITLSAILPRYTSYNATERVPFTSCRRVWSKDPISFFFHPQNNNNRPASATS